MITRFGIHWLVPLSLGVALFAGALRLAPLGDVASEVVSAAISFLVAPILPLILTGTEAMFGVDLARRLYGRHFCRLWGLDLAEDHRGT